MENLIKEIGQIFGYEVLSPNTAQRLETAIKKFKHNH